MTVTPKEFQFMSREARLEILRLTAAETGIESEEYRKLTNKHLWALKRQFKEE